MNKIMIGVLPLWDENKESLWMLPGYFKGILDTGAIPVMLPLTKDNDLIEYLADKFDGFLFTGGHDINPNLYGEVKLQKCGQVCEARDILEKVLFSKILELDKPMLGICRGIQLFNVLLGGDLYQDLSTQHADEKEINHLQSPPYDIAVHTVKLVDSPLAELIKVHEIGVNSYHHQSIKRLAPKLSPMAYSPDGLIEAVYMPGKKYVWAVQWHPEFMPSDAASQKLFLSFINACHLR